MAAILDFENISNKLYICALRMTTIDYKLLEWLESDVPLILYRISYIHTYIQTDRQTWLPYNIDTGCCATNRTPCIILVAKYRQSDRLYLCFCI